MKLNAGLTLRAADEMSYCQEAIRELSGDGPVMVAAEYRRKQNKENAASQAVQKRTIY